MRPDGIGQAGACAMPGPRPASASHSGGASTPSACKRRLRPPTPAVEKGDEERRGCGARGGAAGMPFGTGGP
eukprot:9323907-Pyramimonas_sp.AAC.2